jgi:transposase InsO family protein
MPKIGGRKLYKLIEPELPDQLSIGRDLFFDFLRQYGLLSRRRRSRIRTTYSDHWMRKYPNLIKDFTPKRPHQLLVSDITFIKTEEGWGFLSLVTDGYSRKITGWAMGKTLESNYTVDALKMAIDQVPKGIKNIYHHSDRGAQYCCRDYIKVLKKNHFKISMTENGDPRENALAERVNGILKMEWLHHIKLGSIEEASEKIEEIIKIYNDKRPHASLNMMTPSQAHNQTGELKKLWKNYFYNKDKDEKKIHSFVSSEKSGDPL